MNNVINFKGKSNNKYNHDHSCPNCDFISKEVKFFVEDVQEYDVNSEEFADEVDSLIRYIQDTTKEETIRQIGLTLIKSANSMTEDEEDEDDRSYDDECGEGCECDYDV